MKILKIKATKHYKITPWCTPLSIEAFQTMPTPSPIDEFFWGVFVSHFIGFLEKLV
jgi:hypothetical protein